MKKKYKLLMISLLLIVFTGFARPDKAMAQRPQVAVNFQFFYNTLSPYGNWISYPGYGQVWAPNAGVDFQPYSTAGHWVYSDYGWTWVSDYSWGWAPFHYGRWLFDNSYGWLWVPGMEWGPAWVAWRDSPDYYGWAPLRPGMGVNISVGINIPSPLWVFVPHAYITSPYLHRYYMRRPENVYIMRRSVLINHIYQHEHNAYFAGPRTANVRRFTHHDVVQVRINDDNRPGASRIDNKRLNIYRPRIDANIHTDQAPVRNFADNNHISHNNQRTFENRQQPNNPPQQNQQEDHIKRNSDIHLRDNNGRRLIGQPAPAKAPARQQQASPQRTFHQNNNNIRQSSPHIDFKDKQHAPAKIMNASPARDHHPIEQHSLQRSNRKHS